MFSCCRSTKYLKLLFFYIYTILSGTSTAMFWWGRPLESYLAQVELWASILFRFGSGWWSSTSFAEQPRARYTARYWAADTVHCYRVSASQSFEQTAKAWFQVMEDDGSTERPERSETEVMFVHHGVFPSTGQRKFKGRNATTAMFTLITDEGGKRQLTSDFS